ncbi:MAG: hypothetical protein Q8R02_16775 [Hyphomonadaceae bacterium]|nr:hypothetical protein [Hyphomonadaceae bacterium]
MTDRAQSARHDLAFMKELAEDRGPLPSILGAHLLAVGAPYGLNVIYAWAGMRGFVPWPEDWYVWSWAPGTAVYLPILAVILFTSRGLSVGPAGRAFAAAWSGVGLMTWVIIALLAIAASRTGLVIWTIWPALAVTLYGGAWTVIGLVRRRYWSLLVAAGCFATALSCAALIDTPEHWLAMGLGLLLCMAVPGAAMMRMAKTAEAKSAQA